MGKPTICICENKGADQVTAKLISAFVFVTRIVRSLYFLNTKFHASSHLLLLCSLVCVGPGRKPQRWFSHKAAQIKLFFFSLKISIFLLQMKQDINITPFCTLEKTVFLSRSFNSRSINVSLLVLTWKLSSVHNTPDILKV